MTTHNDAVSPHAVSLRDLGIDVRADDLLLGKPSIPALQARLFSELQRRAFLFGTALGAVAIGTVWLLTHSQHGRVQAQVVKPAVVVQEVVVQEDVQPHAAPEAVEPARACDLQVATTEPIPEQQQVTAKVVVARKQQRSAEQLKVPAEESTLASSRLRTLLTLHARCEEALRQGDAKLADDLLAQARTHTIEGALDREFQLLADRLEQQRAAAQGHEP